MAFFSRQPDSSGELRFWKLATFSLVGLLGLAVWSMVSAPAAADLGTLSACTRASGDADAMSRRAADLEDAFRRQVPGGLALQLTGELPATETRTGLADAKP